jgi:toluene monooxygenase system ferredoxin subunit
MSKTIEVCSVTDIPANGMKSFKTGDGLGILVANFNERYYAYSDSCPHQGTCLGEGFYDGAVLTCHKHLWQWDITTGKPIGLAKAGLEGYQVEIANDKLYVRPASALRMAELFSDISESTLAELEKMTRREEFEVGSVLYDIGEATDDLYILESGRVEFQFGRDDRTSAAGFILRKGEVFGWAALLEHQPQRIARAVCVEDSVLLRLNGEEAVQVLAANPESGYNVMRQLNTLITKHLTSSGVQ